MMHRHQPRPGRLLLNPLILLIGAVGAGLTGCASQPTQDTLAALREVEPDITEVVIDDSLEKAMAGYREFLESTPANAKTPDAMRRLADLQIEKEYGIIGADQTAARTAPQAVRRATSRDDRTEMVRPEAAGDLAVLTGSTETGASASIADLSESEVDFEQRATGQQLLPAFDSSFDLASASDETAATARPTGPQEAIETYQRILTEYPHYERNDEVLYQMARAYDELGEPDEAMAVMERLLREYGGSGYSDEVYFRRAEYFFVRKKYLDAEEAYSAVVAMGTHSDFYELALYKLGWSFYKQELYTEALDQYVALLDFKVSVGYDFDTVLGSEPLDAGLEGAAEQADAAALADAGDGAQEERRVTDTFRVISLAFSNLGGPEVLNQYFSANGNRAYEDRIYSNLGEFYLTKLRYNDAATVYRSFTELNPFHKVAPHFSMRVVEVYGEGNFAQLVVEAKKEFASRYGLNAMYWQHFDSTEAPEVLSYLKTNLKDLANHYHSLYQDEGLLEEQPEHYAEALNWYGEFLASFPGDTDSPAINYQLAELYLAHEDFPAAAREYERTAYDYQSYEQADAAGYAAIFAHREHLKVVTEDQTPAARTATVASSLRFAETFPAHEHAATVLGAAAEDLYDMGEHERAVTAGSWLIDDYPDAEDSLKSSAWSVVAHGSFDLARYPQAEHAYQQVLGLTSEDDESRQALYDNLAAAIYKQGELARETEDHRVAADHFLRIKLAAPGSGIRPAAEYDAAASLMKLQDWTEAAAVFRDFREVHVEHELQPEVTKQLAYVYRQAGELSRSAEEYEQVAVDAEDPELRRETTLLAGQLYQDAGDERAMTVYQRYVETFPSPVDVALETRFKIATMHLSAAAAELYHDELGRIVTIDAQAGAERTPRTRYLAAQSSLVLSKLRYDHFIELELSQPFAESLTEKQARMDVAMAALEALVDYEVAEVTAAATYYIAGIYGNFGRALLDSERPTGLSAIERADYELAIEEEAFPFEERAIEVHEENVELMVAGTFNSWVEKSLGELAVLMPGRYAKQEIFSGFIGPLPVFAYRSPNAPDPFAAHGDLSLELEADQPAEVEPGGTESADEGTRDVTSAF